MSAGVRRRGRRSGWAAVMLGGLLQIGICQIPADQQASAMASAAVWTACVARLWALGKRDGQATSAGLGAGVAERSG